MLPQKQQCLARNHLGMICHCQALSSGRCHFHSALFAGAPVRKSRAERAGGMMAVLEFWRELLFPSPVRSLRQTPVAFTL